MDRYAVVGNPIAHSLSPEIHRAFARQTGERLRYDKLFAPKDGFAATATGFFKSGGKGLNVTLPFKAQAHRWVSVADPAADRCGAVNTIGLNNGATVGFNTDGLGLLRDLQAQSQEVAGRKLLVIGAGGAVAGILDALVGAGADRIHIANRTASKARALAARHQGRVEASSLENVKGGFDIIVNGASAGLEGKGGLVEPRLAQGAACYDLLYSRDGHTPFCRWAQQAGAAWVSDGLGMLVEQAAAAFAIWRARRPDARAVLRALRPNPAA